MWNVQVVSIVRWNRLSQAFMHRRHHLSSIVLVTPNVRPHVQNGNVRARDLRYAQYDCEGTVIVKSPASARNNTVCIYVRYAVSPWENLFHYLALWRGGVELSHAQTTDIELMHAEGFRWNVIFGTRFEYRMKPSQVFDASKMSHINIKYSMETALFFGNKCFQLS